MSPAELRRKRRMAENPELAARRREHDSRRRPGRKDTRKRHRAKPYVIAPIDGEGFEFPRDVPLQLPDSKAGQPGEVLTTESRYCLLQILGLEGLWAEQGLGTETVLRYLFQAPSTWVLVGFGLHYDVENWLRDVPDDLYLRMVNDAEEVTWNGWTLRYLPRKLLIVETDNAKLHPQSRNPEGVQRRTVFDALGYFQASLPRALEKAGLGVAQEIVEGKAARGGFQWAQRDAVERYNMAELVAMRRLFEHLRDSVNRGLKEACWPFQMTRHDWYGPGALAKKMLQHSGWTEEHPHISLSPIAMHAFLSNPRAHHWNAPFVARFPFSAAYFGGRIEEAAVGRWPRVYDDDLHSAYPCAMARLPKWRAEDAVFETDARKASAQLRKASVGMYLLEWDMPEGWDFYPLPYRTRSHNVHFPRTGCGWVMAPEALAALDTYGWHESLPSDHEAPEEAITDPEELEHLLRHGRPGIRCLQALYLRGTEGLGRGEDLPPPAQRSTVSKMITEGYVQRQAMVEAGDSAELAMKMSFNSGYGKAWQQVGVKPEDPKLFSDLGGAWITAWTRGQIWRRLWGHHADQTVISIQTDGVCSTLQLSTENCGPGLGQWEGEWLEDYRQFLPGIYDYFDAAKGKRGKKTRGFTNRFDPDEAWKVVTGQAKEYAYTYRFFVGRRHALAQPSKWGKARYQWCQGRKDFRLRLGSKRVELPDLQAPSRLLAEADSLARVMQRDAAAAYRTILRQVAEATEGSMIRPDGTDEAKQLPAAFKRKASPFDLHMAAEAMGCTSRALIRQVKAAQLLRDGGSTEGYRREAEALIRRSPEFSAAVSAAMAEQQRRKDGAPAWTQPKANVAWQTRAQMAHPFRLKFEATPFVITDTGERPEDGEPLTVRTQLEDAEGEEGLFVAGIGE